MVVIAALINLTYCGYGYKKVARRLSRCVDENYWELLRVASQRLHSGLLCQVTYIQYLIWRSNFLCRKGFEFQGKLSYPGYFRSPRETGGIRGENGPPDSVPAKRSKVAEFENIWHTTNQTHDKPAGWRWFRKWREKFESTKDGKTKQRSENRCTEPHKSVHPIS